MAEKKGQYWPLSAPRDGVNLWLTAVHAAALCLTSTLPATPAIGTRE